MSDKLLHLLSAGLHRDVAKLFLRRANSLNREAQHHLTRQPSMLRLGWTSSKIRAVCILAAFQQTVLAPIASAAANPTMNLGSVMPIRVGSMLLDKLAMSNIYAAASDFDACVARFGIPRFALQAESGWAVVNAILKGEERK